MCYRKGYPICFMSLADKQTFKELLVEITWDMFHLFHIIDIFMLISNDS